MEATYMEDSAILDRDDPNVISPHQRLRRDSIAHLQGVGGVSWGSLSIGSWLRDEVMFHHNHRGQRKNSLYPIATRRRSSVIHPQDRGLHGFSTSPPVSYNAILPNLEEQYCKDYSCCGISLPGLHDLLKHYEEAHIDPAGSSATATVGNPKDQGVSRSKSKVIPSNSTTNNPNTPQHMNIIRQQLKHDGIHGHHNHHQVRRQSRSNSNTALGQQYMGHVPHSASPSPTSSQITSTQTTPLVGKNTALSSNHTTPAFSQTHRMNNKGGNLLDTVPTNDVFLNVMNQANIQKLGYTGQVPNQTVSFSNYSINFSDNINESSGMTEIRSPESIFRNNQPIQNKNHGSLSTRITPEPTVSVTTTHAHPDMLTNKPTGLVQNNPPLAQQSTPAKNDNNEQMKSPSTNNMPSPVQPPVNGTPQLRTDSTSSSKITTPTHSVENESVDLARRLYSYENEENKPFKCPVLGCDKTYKNQNGLKYHRLHGHQNQTLIENPDGTYSIVDPDSNEIYLENLQDIKDKPYRCDVCGKRYKNLNGLKYHRGHSTH